jgi:hypothetical protein
MKQEMIGGKVGGTIRNKRKETLITIMLSSTRRQATSCATEISLDISAFI